MIKSLRDTIKSKKPGDECDKLTKETDELERRWSHVSGIVKKRYQQIQRIMPQAHVYAGEVDHFAPWLDDVEKQLKGLPEISSIPEELLHRKRDLEVS